MAKEEGGIAVMEVPAGAMANQMGLLAGDLIQGVNGQAVSNLVQFFEALPQSNEAPLQLRLVRHQDTTIIELPPRPSE